MTKRHVMVVHQTFAFKGKIVERGAVIFDPEEIAFVRAHHPEKAVASLHHYDEVPAPVVVPTQAESASPAPFVALGDPVGE